MRMRAFLQALAAGQIAEALKIVKEKNLLPSVTGRFCTEPFGEFNLTDQTGSAVSYRALERFVGDTGPVKAAKIPADSKGRVAVVGSGVAGLTTAGVLRQYGYAVTVFEKESTPGGVLRWGIPQFRLPRKYLEREIDYLKSLNVHFECNCLVGQLKDFKSLEEDFDAVYLATGSALAKQARIPGENTPGVYYADDFLEKINHWQKTNGDVNDLPLLVGPKVIIIGSGNAACDCARVCVRLGCTVVIVIRKTEQEMGVRRHIFKQLKKEGVKIEVMVNTIEITANGSLGVNGVVLRRYDYAETYNENEWLLEEVAGSEFTMSANNVIVAIGHEPAVAYKNRIAGLKLNEDRTIWTQDNSAETSIEKYFAGGNVVDGAGPIMGAILSAQRAAGEIDGYLRD